MRPLRNYSDYYRDGVAWTLTMQPGGRQNGHDINTVDVKYIRSRPGTGPFSRLINFRFIDIAYNSDFQVTVGLNSFNMAI